MSKSESKKLSLSAAWAMAVGGMIGGGIFSVLGVVIEQAGHLAWLSFCLGGGLALVTGWSYSRLTIIEGQSGGIYQFLRAAGHSGAAATVSWVLILGYVLTVSVYAHTFGSYVANVFDGGLLLSHIMGIVIILLITGVNLLGVGESSVTQILLVVGKLLVLGALALIGLLHWSPAMLAPTGETPGVASAIVGAALVFMAYEGFQLLAYDYDVMEQPSRNLPLAIMTSIIAVIIIYVGVALGATMLVGADRIIADKEVALAAAGDVAFGQVGLIVVTIAAAFSTGSAILATVFATARLAQRVAKEGDLPSMFGRTNAEGVPMGATLLIAGAACILVSIGSLSELVGGASMVFLVTFAAVNFLAWRRNAVHAVIGLSGFLGALVAAVLLTQRLYQQVPMELALIALIVMGAIIFGVWRENASVRG